MSAAGSRRRLGALLAAALVWLCWACSASTVDDGEDEEDDGVSIVAVADDHEEVSDYAWDEADEVAIILADSGISVAGSGAAASGSTLTIDAAGTYRISGSLSDGRLLVAAGVAELVRIVLDGASVASSSGAALSVESAGKVVLVLASGSANSLADSAGNDLEAVLYAACDLSIYGEEGGDGTMTVTGVAADGIAATGGLVLNSATIGVTAADDGICGEDYVVVRGGSISVDAAGDGLKATNDEEDSLGYVSIESGTLELVCGGDGIMAETQVLLTDGELILTSGGGSACAVAEDGSAKGLKAGALVDIDGGSIDIDAADDAIHSDGDISIDGGDIAIATYAGAGDGIHADGSLAINGGTIVISACYEGLEGSVVTVAGGAIHLVAEDDGVNASGDEEESLSYRICVTGGYLYVEAGGDGLDSNGSIAISGGTVIVNGPTANDNAALDYADTLSGAAFSLTGGTLVAVGSKGMAVAPTGCGQPVVKLSLASTAPAGSLVRLQDADGAVILAFASAKAYQSAILSSPGMAIGETYYVYTGGSCSGAETDGLYSGGTCSGGTLRGSFTAAASVATFSAN